MAILSVEYHKAIHAYKKVIEVLENIGIPSVVVGNQISELRKILVRNINGLAHLRRNEIYGYKTPTLSMAEMIKSREKLRKAYEKERELTLQEKLASGQ